MFRFWFRFKSTFSILNKKCWLKKGYEVGRETSYLYFSQPFCAATVIINEIEIHRNLQGAFALPPTNSSSFQVQQHNKVVQHSYTFPYDFSQLLNKCKTPSQTAFGEENKNYLSAYEKCYKGMSSIYRHRRKYISET